MKKSRARAGAGLAAASILDVLEPELRDDARQFDNLDAVLPFLQKLLEGFTVLDACKEAKLSRPQLTVWRQKNPWFDELWSLCEDAGADVLEAEATRRAKDGVEEPVFFKGEICGSVTRYSDQLMIRLLEAKRPEKYRARSEVKGSANVVVKLVGDDASLV